MLSIRNQIICLSIAMLLMTCFQPDQVNGQIKKKKLLKGLMGASLLKLFKAKKVFPLPIPLPIDWQTQAGLLSKNNAPSHVSHQSYAQQAIQLSPIEYSDYQNAISQALSNSNSYIPSQYGSSSSGYSNSASSSSSSNDNSGYGSSNDNSGYSSSNDNSGYNSNNAQSNGYDGSVSNSNDENQSNYGVAGVSQNDEYNAYQVSNNDASSNGYRAAASSINPNYNVNYNSNYNSQPNYGSYNNYVPNYNQFNNGQQEYSQPAAEGSETSNDQQQFNSYNLNNNQGSNQYEDNSGSASSNSYVATSSNQQANNYMPLRPIYHHLQSNTYQQSNTPQNYASNGWIALD